jgi:hypothetical protein
MVLSTILACVDFASPEAWKGPPTKARVSVSRGYPQEQERKTSSN